MPRPSRSDTLPRAVLFDLDDTLFDHTLTCRATLAELRESNRFLRALPLDELTQEYGRILGTTHGHVVFGRRNVDDDRVLRFERLAVRCGRRIDRPRAVELARTYRARYLELRRPVPGAVEFVRRLAGRARIAIVTDHTVAEQTEKLAFLGIEPIVDALVTAEEVGVMKPDPRVFRTALERVGASPSESAMVGDMWSYDVLGARRAGVRPVWFNRFGLPRPDDEVDVPEFSTFRARRKLEALLAVSPGAA
jgi:HAD superfamily hydrolase (TIGR01509 family)